MPKVKTTTVIDNLVRNYATLDAQVKLIEASKQTLRNRIIEFFKANNTNEWTADGATIKMVVAETLKFNDEAMAELLGRKFNEISVRVTDREKFKSAVTLGRLNGFDLTNAVKSVVTERLLVDGKATSKLSFTIE